jgi:hypothetical protein
MGDQQLWTLHLGIEAGELVCVIEGAGATQELQVSFGSGGSDSDVDALQQLNRVIYEQVTVKGKKSGTASSSGNGLLRLVS